MHLPYAVIIIAGGATGAGIARDCSLRVIKALLLDRPDISTGATGRNHGLLHSGARYAVTDHESAVAARVTGALPSLPVAAVPRAVLRAATVPPGHCARSSQASFIRLLLSVRCRCLVVIVAPAGGR